MTKITYIPGEIANAAIDEHGNRKPVTRTQHIFDDARDKSQAEINKEFGNAIGGLNSQNYVTVDSFNALPDTGETDTVYRVSNWDGTQQDPTVYSEYAWDGSRYVHLSTKTQIGEVFDISAYHATGGTLATYADLSAALDSNNGGGVPQSLQKGGMSVKFVQSSDNKYVKCRYMSSSTAVADFTNVANWQGVDSEPTIGSKNMVESGGFVKFMFNNKVTLTGNAATSRTYINVNAGHSYRIYPITKTWDVGTSGYYAFAIGYRLNDTDTDVIGVSRSGFSTTANFYDIEIPSGVDTMMVRATGPKGQNVYFIVEDITYTNYHFGIKISTGYRNGSAGSTSNANFVTTEVLPIDSKDKYVIFHTTRPNTTNYNYCFGCVFTSSLSDIGSVAVKSGLSGFISEIVCEAGNGVLFAKIPENAVGVNFSIGEYGTNNSYNPLRTGSFSGYSLFVSTAKNDGCIFDYLNGLINDGIADLKRKINNAYITTVSPTSDARIEFDAVPEHKYRIYPITKQWNVTGNTGYYVIAFGYVNNGSMTDLNGEARVGFTQLKDYYDITLPADIDNIAVRVRGVAGQTIKFRIEDITPIDQFISAITPHITTIGVANRAFYKQSATPNVTYRITPTTKSWNITGATAYYVIAFGYWDEANERMVDLSGVARQGFTELGDYYDITIPKGITNICIGAIGVANQIICFNIDNVSDIKELRKDVNSLLTEDICRMNIDKIPMITASCRYMKSSNTSKDFQMLIVTDSHYDFNSVKNAVSAANGFDKIDAMIHCGDFIDGQINNMPNNWSILINNSTKPCFFVIGNHDAGNYVPILFSPTETQLYNCFIKPIVDKGWLSNGEYTENKCYYYHDFSSLAVRLIVLYEYEPPRIVDTDNPYWEAIPYNSSLDNYVVGQTYNTGDEINVPTYALYSFRCKQTVTTVYYNNTVPSYKYRMGGRWIQQTQAQWFLDTLYSTPSGYKVVVACHNPFSDKADVDQTKIFSQKNNWVNGYGMQNYMVNDFVADAINAFQNKQDFSTTCISEYPDDMQSYQVSKDFRSVAGTFHSIIGGHVHQDCVWKHQTYNQYQITPICSNTLNYAQKPGADIRTSPTTEQRIDNDCLTVVSFGNNRIGLVKIGVNVTENGDKRDFEVIDISGN